MSQEFINEKVESMPEILQAVKDAEVVTRVINI